MKHFTYKITFPGMPWFYYGVHTDNGKPYFGSPKTHKWIWNFYEHEIQILEWFENRREAEQVEDRLIKHFMEDVHCLNEHYGSHFSEDARNRGREKSNKINSEKRRKSGRQMAQLNVETGRQAEFGRLSKGASKNFSAEEIRRRTEILTNFRTPETARKGGLSASKKKFRCTVTGYVSNACGLTSYQKARGIDTSLREVYFENQSLN
jgi:hypothetical protein